MAKVEITAEQLKDLVTTGTFAVEKKYFGGKVIGKFRMLSSFDVAKIAKEIRERNAKLPKETDEEYDNRIENIVNENINTKIYSAKTSEGEDIVIDSQMFMKMDADYMEMKAVFEKLFKDGEYDDEVKYYVQEAAKN